MKCSVALVVAVVVMMAAATTALRFDLHQEGPTCFEVELSADEAQHGKQMTVVYSSNWTNDRGHAPSDLQIKAYAPKLIDGVSQDEKIATEHNSYVVKASKAGRPFSFRISGVQIPSLFASTVGKDYVHGTYEVCFTRDRHEGIGFIFNAAIKERAQVTIETFAGERYTQSLATSMSSQAKSSERGDGYNSEAEHHTKMQTHVKKNSGKKSHEDTIHDAIANELNMKIRNMNFLVDSVMEGVRDLRTRHENFHATSESSFSRVWTFSLATMAAMAFSCWRTYKSTTKMLKDKKLV